VIYPLIPNASGVETVIEYAVLLLPIRKKHGPEIRGFERRPRPTDVVRGSFFLKDGMIERRLLLISRLVVSNQSQSTAFGEFRNRLNITSLPIQLPIRANTSFTVINLVSGVA
jgi:hypothetical protein